MYSCKFEIQLLPRLPPTPKKRKKSLVGKMPQSISEEVSWRGTHLDPIKSQRKKKPSVPGSPGQPRLGTLECLLSPRFLVPGLQARTFPSVCTERKRAEQTRWERGWQLHLPPPHPPPPPGRPGPDGSRRAPGSPPASTSPPAPREGKGPPPPPAPRRRAGPRDGARASKGTSHLPPPGGWGRAGPAAPRRWGQRVGGGQAARTPPAPRIPP